MSAAEDPRRNVPRTDHVLNDPRVAQWREQVHGDIVVAAVREVLSSVRSGRLAPDEVIAAVDARLRERTAGLRPLLNATGVVLHTNLGRAPLAPDAVRAVTRAAGYVDVEYDVRTGERARRGRGAIDALLARVPRAQGAHIVNNGAAALVLAATGLAAGREIVVSRGELVEIGDGFRIPELIESTGARLREVGATNRVHLDDYAAALGPRTGFVLKVHPSNFVIRGFTAAVSIRELASLGVPVVADIGSGLLAPDPLLPDEPDAGTALADGASLVTSSGDKLLGGPQAGLLLGSDEIVDALRRHPLARALRVDKLTLAALAATLTAPATPTADALRAEPAQLRHRAEALAAALSDAGVSCEVVPSAGLVGGGGSPERLLDGWAVALPERVARALRLGQPCVVARVENGICLVDPRCVPSEADDDLARAVLAACPPGTDDACM
ncbi:MAG TPA: L-seryl-tRNA(Sec) selenium transferase [Jatrophihabitantaceae bacterium]